MADMAKIRRENIRWQILLTLNNARPNGCFESVILSVVQAEYPDATLLEIRKESDYLAERDLIEINKRPDGKWHGKLIRYGVDVVEYTVDVEPGIARPEKYFDA
jgi:hypothetical protein